MRTDVPVAYRNITHADLFPPGLAQGVSFERALHDAAKARRERMLRAEPPPVAIALPAPVTEIVVKKSEPPDNSGLWFYMGVLVAQEAISGKPNGIRTIKRIQIECAAFFDISLDDLLSPRRTVRVVLPRQVAMYLSKTMTTRSLPELGRLFHRDHTTLLSAIRKIERLLDTVPGFADQVKAIASRINGPSVRLTDIDP